MTIALIIICILLISFVLLQGGAEGDGGLISGGNSDLFANRKERGGELFMTRFTFVLGLAFMILCAIL